MSRITSIRIAVFALVASLLLPGLAARPSATAVIARTPQADVNLTQYVNPFIGTDDSNSPNPVPGGAGGSTFPGASVPFGMVQFSPDTPTGSPSGYRYRDTTVEDFSMTHFNGAGCSNNEDLNILPITGAIGASPGTAWTSYSSGHTKANEAAAPGYYKTRLDRYSTDVELSATTRTGFAKLTYPATTQATVLINPSRMGTGTRAGAITIVGTDSIEGSTTGGGFCGGRTFSVYYAIQFDQSFSGFGTFLGSTVTSGSTSASGIQAGGYATFDTTANQVVHMKVGISYVSIANAKANLAAENPGWAFATIKSNADAAWNAILNRIQVTGGVNDDLIKFYTALYHVLQNPTVASDVNGEYMGFDFMVHTKPAEVGAIYQNYSGWDIYRSWAALVAMIAPDEMSDIVESMVLDGEQGGLLPKWSHQNVEDFVMTGDPGPIIVSSAYAFGARDFDTASALNLMNKSGSVVGAAQQGNPIRGRLSTYFNLHYLSGDASDSQEYSASDFAIAQFAQALGDTAKYDYFMAHAQWWINTFNTTSNYIQARNGNGTWAHEPLNPAAENGFVEGNAAQYTWMVPYNMRSLIDLMGGNHTAVQRLDHLFTQLNAGLTQPYFYIGNEPEFSTPWAYNFAAAPWKTQNVVRRILDESFTKDPGGLPGNDDLGATSGVQVWAYLGLYPAIPGADTLVLNGPTFSAATIRLDGGNILQINGAGAGAGNQYIQGLTVNGTPTTRNWVPFSAISGGATLNFTMGSTPNTAWGSGAADLPPSFNAGFTPPPAAPDLGVNLALGKPATADSSCGAAEAASKAVDDALVGNSKWCSLGANKWLQVDLGADVTVSTFVIKHAGLGGESTGLNTKDFTIQVSSDGINWTNGVSVTGNMASRSVHTMAPTTARYVRLNIITPTSTGNNAARIYEFEVYSNTAPPSPTATPTPSPTPTPTPPPGVNLALNKPATASTPCGGAEGPEKAVDGSVIDNSKWCSLAADKWLQVDLGGNALINSFIIRHAGAGDEAEEWNTPEFSIQISADATTWTTPVSVTDNAQSITYHPINPANARYIRLNVIRGEICCGSTATRIYEFEAYGEFVGGPTATPTGTPTIGTPTATPTGSPTPTTTATATATATVGTPTATVGTPGPFNNHDYIPLLVR